MRNTCIAILVLALPWGPSLLAAAALPPEGFIIGADISWVQQQEQEGRRFKDGGFEKDVLEILKDHGFNWMRLRIFHNPRAPKGYSKDGYCDLEHTLKMAERIKAAQLQLLLDFHYSDNWADPGKQYKPQAWKHLPFEELTAAVHDYTSEVLAAFRNRGLSPEMVQIGNEISNGFLWPDGRLSDWDKFTTLVEAGIAGAKQADPNVAIMLHIASGGQNERSRYFLENVLERGVQFDVIGQSYYPKWHGTLDDLHSNLSDLALRYKQPIIVVEYSQHKLEVNRIVRNLPNRKGFGTFIWEPTRWGEPLFDRSGNALPNIELYLEIDKKSSGRAD